MFDEEEIVLLKRSEFYKTLLAFHGPLDGIYADYAMKNYKRWFAVHPDTGEMWLADVDMFNEFKATKIIFVGHYRDVAVPLYDADAKYLGMCRYQFDLAGWLRGETMAEVFEGENRGRGTDMGRWTKVKIIPDD